MSWCLKNTSLPKGKEVILSFPYHLTLPDSVTRHPSALISPKHQVSFFQKSVRIHSGTSGIHLSLKFADRSLHRPGQIIMEVPEKIF